MSDPITLYVVAHDEVRKAMKRDLVFVEDAKVIGPNETRSGLRAHTIVFIQNGGTGIDLERAGEIRCALMPDGKEIWC